MRRRQFLATASALIAQPFAQAQSPVRPARIGFLVPYSRQGFEPRIEAFRDGLREFGYEEGRNLTVVLRSPEGRTELLPALARELVASNIDVLVTGGSRATRVLRDATTAIPIVMTNTGDAVAAGLITSLARPGGNITGITYFIQDLYAKRLELLKELGTPISEVAVLIDATNPATFQNIKKMESVASSLAIALHTYETRRTEDFEDAFAAMSKKGVQAVTVLESPLLNINVRKTAGLALKFRLPSSGSSEFGDAGGLIGYGVDILALHRRAAYFVDRILKGANPAQLPVEQPTRFEFVLNMRTAKALGFKVPQAIVLRADRVAE